MPLHGDLRVVLLGPRPPDDVVDALVAQVRRTGRPAVGTRPVTDTVKQVDADGFVVATLDREGLREPVGPVVLAADDPALAAGGVEPVPAVVLARVLAGVHDLVEVPPVG